MSNEEHSWRWLAGMVSDALLQLDGDGCILYASEQAAALLDCDRTGLTGKPFSGFTHAEDAEQVAGLLTQCARDGGAHFSGACRLSANGRQWRWLRICGCEGDDGTMLLVLHDLSPSQQLSHADSSIGAMQALAGDFIHDLNNVLVGISGNVFLLKRLAATQPDLMKKLDSIEKLGQRAAAMADKLRVISRKGDSIRDEVQFLPLLEEVVAGVRDDAAAHVELSVGGLPADAATFGNPAALRRMLFYLLDHGWYAIRQRAAPVIRLRAETVAADDAYRLEHPDMPADSLIRLDLWVDGGDVVEAEAGSEEGEEEGMKLAVSVAANVVRKHSGLLSVSGNIGRGLELEIRLPVKPS